MTTPLVRRTASTIRSHSTMENPRATGGAVNSQALSSMVMLLMTKYTSVTTLTRNRITSYQGT